MASGKIDYTDTVKHEKSFELLLAEVSARFVNISPDHLDSQIEIAQKEICQFLDIDLSALWQWSEEPPHFLTITHLFSPSDGPERPDGIRAEEAFPWLLKRARRGDTLVVQTEKLPPEASIDKESRRFFGVKSSVMLPLCSGDKEIIGVLSFDSLTTEREWSELLVDRLSLISQIFSSSLARKRGELKLKENEKRLRLATRAASIGLWVMDVETEYVWATPETREIFQFETDARLDYQCFMEKIVEPDRAAVDKAVHNAIDKNEKLDLTFKLRLTDNSIRWVHAKGRFYQGKNWKQGRFMGTSIDVTESRQMQKKLQSQLKEIKTLKNRLEKENIYLQKKVKINYIHDEIIFRSSKMQTVLDQVEQVAQTDSTVLIGGETGTGKELIARAVHRLSSRCDRPMVTVNCASLPPSLVESELFGREKGAFTGALTKMIGRFETADGATLFLDEVGELPLEIQAKLLRVIENGSFERLGSTRTIHVDVRIIAATNQVLSDLVAKGKFRKDLYFRLNIFPVYIPPLRERTEDIAPLIWAFVREYEKKMGKRIDNIPQKNIIDLQNYYWSGNVRELRNVVERSLITSNTRTLQILLPFENDNNDHADATLEEMERNHIIRTLEKTGWRISGAGSASEILGLKRTTLQSKMKKLGVRRSVSSAE